MQRPKDRPYWGAQLKISLEPRWLTTYTCFNTKLKIKLVMKQYLSENYKRKAK